MLTRESSRYDIAHHVGLAGTKWREVPALRVPVINWLAIRRPIDLAISGRRSTLQKPQVQARLSFGGVGEDSGVQGLVANPEFVVAHVVC